MSRKRTKSITLTSELSEGAKIKAPVVFEVENYDYPVFCFRHLHKDHNLDHCDKEERKSLIDRLVKLGQSNWSAIQLLPKHGLGSEKINRNSIKPSIPKYFTNDVKFFLAFRFQGKKVFIGHRNKFIFHIIYIDRNFSVYDHS